eukprot:5344567-Amphidinium_carterae.1
MLLDDLYVCIAHGLVLGVGSWLVHIIFIYFCCASPPRASAISHKMDKRYLESASACSPDSDSMGGIWATR